jgi:hypothetical protein
MYTANLETFVIEVDDCTVIGNRELSLVVGKLHFIEWKPPFLFDMNLSNLNILFTARPVV